MEPKNLVVRNVIFVKALLLTKGKPEEMFSPVENN